LFKFLKFIAKLIVGTLLTIIFLLAALVWFFGGDEYADTMPPIDSADTDGQGGFQSFPRAQGAPEIERGETLSAPSPFDDRSIVEAEDVKNWSSGTAFAIGGASYWLTAKHVARGCDRLGIVNEDGRIAVKARTIYIAEDADIAILETTGGPRPLSLDLDESDIKLGSKGFHVGYPQGKPGEVRSRLIGRELMITKGAWRSKENTLAWAEVGRSQGLDGSLGGLSGGPAFDARGNVVGITIAESPRRGRVITTVAPSIIAALQSANVPVNEVPQAPINDSTFTAQAQQLRAGLKVVQVICMVGS
jgi:serine protease Do